MSEKKSIEGLLLKHKTGMLSSWKKHWVFSDGIEFKQWSESSRPSPNNKPKHIFSIKNCIIRKSSLRKFAFEILDLLTDKSMVFAADDSQTYQKWMQILIVQIESTRESSPIRKPNIPENKRQSFADGQMEYIYKYFSVSDKSTNAYKVIKLAGLNELIKLIDPSLSFPRVLRLMMQYFNLASDDSIGIQDFIVFWKDNSPLLYTSKDQLFIDQTIQLALHSQTMFEKEMLSLSFMGEMVPSQASHRLLPIALRIPFPTHAKPSILVPTGQTTIHNTNTDWNSQLIGYKLQLDRLEQQLYLDRNTDISEEYIVTLYALTQLWGTFQNIAIQGAKIIIDEHTLPEKFKSIPILQKKPVSMTFSETNNNNNKIQLQRLIYEYQGLYLLIIQPEIPLEQLHDLSPTIEQEILLAQELHEQYTQQQWKGNQFINHELNLLLAEEQLKQVHGIQTCNNQKNIFEKIALMGKLLPKLMTIVEYSGFKVVVFVPTPSSVSSFVEDFFEEHSNDDQETIKSNDPKVELTEQLLHKLEQRVHLGKLYSILAKVTWKPLESFVLDNSKKTKEPVELFYVKGHMLLPPHLPRSQSLDLYTHHFRPEFLRRHHHHFSTFYQLKQQELGSLAGMPINPNDEIPSLLSAEIFLHNYNQFFQSSSSPPPPPPPHSTNGTTTDCTSQEEHSIIPDDLISTQELNFWILINHYYYEQCLPSVARMLDSPEVQGAIYDSHSLTQWLHCQGVHMRHIGILYGLVHSFVAKQWLLTEILARASKNIYHRMLKAWALKGKRESLQAEYRQCSQMTDYLEYNEMYKQQRHELSLEIIQQFYPYYFTFHEDSSSSSSTSSPSLLTSAFQQMLYDQIRIKFGLKLSMLLTNHFTFDSLQLNPIQTFHSLEYHLHIVCKDTIYQKLSTQQFMIPQAITSLDMIQEQLPHASWAVSMLPLPPITSFVFTRLIHSTKKHSSLLLLENYECSEILISIYYHMFFQSIYSLHHLSMKNILYLNHLILEYLQILVQCKRWNEIQELVTNYLVHPFIRSNTSIHIAQYLCFVLQAEGSKSMKLLQQPSLNNLTNNNLTNNSSWDIINATMIKSMDILNFMVTNQHALYTLPYIALHDVYLSFIQSTSSTSQQISLATKTMYLEYALILARCIHSLLFSSSSKDYQSIVTTTAEGNNITSTTYPWNWQIGRLYFQLQLYSQALLYFTPIATLLYETISRPNTFFKTYSQHNLSTSSSISSSISSSYYSQELLFIWIEIYRIHLWITWTSYQLTEELENNQEIHDMSTYVLTSAQIALEVLHVFLQFPQDFFPFSAFPNNSSFQPYLQQHMSSFTRQTTSTSNNFTHESTQQLSSPFMIPFIQQQEYLFDYFNICFVLYDVYFIRNELEEALILIHIVWKVFKAQIQALFLSPKVLCLQSPSDNMTKTTSPSTPPASMSLLLRGLTTQGHSIPTIIQIFIQISLKHVELCLMNYPVQARVLLESLHDEWCYTRLHWESIQGMDTKSHAFSIGSSHLTPQQTQQYQQQIQEKVQQIHKVFQKTKTSELCCLQQACQYLLDIIYYDELESYLNILWHRMQSEQIESKSDISMSELSYQSKKEQKFSQKLDELPLGAQAMVVYLLLQNPLLFVECFTFSSA